MPRLRDISKATATLLVVPRAARAKNQANLLTIVRQRQAPPAGTQLDLQPAKKTDSGFFVTEKPARREVVARLKIAAGALILVLFFNLLGTFGTARQTATRVVTTAGSSLRTLLAAGQALAAGDFTTSENGFAAALAALAAAQADAQILTGAGTVLATQPAAVQSGTHLLAAGKNVAAAGQAFAQAAQRVHAAAASWPARQALVSAGQTLQTSFADELAAAVPQITAGLTALQAAAAELAAVNPAVLPPTLATRLPAARTQLTFLLQKIQPYAALLPQLPDLLGARVPQRYLILLQNPAEIRPTGGFIGNYAVVTLNDGFVTEFQLKDVYELDGQLVGRFPPPEGYEQLTNFWGLRDSNTSPDFAVSAQNAAWLFEQGGGGTVDGVVAITADALPALVTRLGGSLQLPRWPQPVAATDLLPLVSLSIESKIDGAAAPKQVLHEIWQALLPKLSSLPATDWLALAHDFAAQKTVQIYARDSASQAAFASLGVAGTLPAAAGSDTLAVVHTSLSGNKSDSYLQTAVSHVTTLSADGAVDTLTLTRTHGWNAAAQTQLTQLARLAGVPLSPALLQIMGAGTNRDLVQIYVPTGAVLLSAGGVPPEAVAVRHTAAGQQYFQFLLETLPGSSQTATLRYRLPASVTRPEVFTQFRQAGLAQTFTHVLQNSAGAVLHPKIGE